MLTRPPLCNGAATGKQCKHYWHVVVPIDAMNAVALHSGETNRMCLRQNGVDMRLNSEGGEHEMATVCNQYEASKRDYDPKLEEYRPLSPEEIEELRAGEALVPVTAGKAKKPLLQRILNSLIGKE